MALNLVPNPGQTLAQTRQPILDNFTNIDNQFAIDHVAFNTVGGGFHNKVEMPPQAAAPVANANDNIFYSKIPAAPFPLTTINETFIHKQVNGVAQTVDIPFTASILSTNANPGNGSTGWSYLPSGILIKWGTIAGAFPNQGIQPFVFPAAGNIPAFAEIYNITLQNVAGNVNDSSNFLTVQTGYTRLGFSWMPRTNFGNVDSTQVFYFAIGK